MVVSHKKRRLSERRSAIKSGKKMVGAGGRRRSLGLGGSRPGSASVFGADITARAPMTNDSIRTAVALWKTDIPQATIEYGDIGDWNVEQVTDMSYMFEGATEFNNDIGNWNVGQVTNMRSMFDGATAFDQPIGKWNVRNVTDMVRMFEGATAFNQPVGEWNVEQVTNMYEMFQNAIAFNQPIGKWNVGLVVRLSRMFRYATAFNQPIGGWDVRNATQTHGVFNGAIAFNQPIGGWDVRNATTTQGMFRGATAFNQPIGEWNLGNVTNMSYMFEGATTFNQPIGEWNVGSVLSMHHMFEGATAFNQPIGEWNVGNVTSMHGIFIGATAFRQDLSGWELSPDMGIRVNVVPRTWFDADYNAEHIPRFLGPPPAPPAPPAPQGLQTNIHSRFDRFVAQHGTEYLTILNRDTAPVPDAPYTAHGFANNLRTQFHEHINVTGMRGDTAEQRELYTNRVNMLMNKIARSGYAFPNNLMKTIAIKSVEYALGQPQPLVPEVGSSMEQPPSFADEYVKVFLNESMESYNSGRVDGGNISCVAGIIERLTTSVGSAAMTMCIGKNRADETCLPEYMRLYRLFSGNEINLNEITQSWAHMYDAGRYADDMTEDEQKVFNDYFDFGSEDARTRKATRKQNYIDYVTGVVESQGEGFLTPDMVTKIAEEADKIDYVFDQANSGDGVQFGGRRTRRARRTRRRTKTTGHRNTNKTKNKSKNKSKTRKKRRGRVVA